MNNSDPWAPDAPEPASAGRAVPSGPVIYLIHFDRPYVSANGKGRAGHYLGWTTDLAARLEAHRHGKGARLMEVIKAAGIGWALARTWPGDRKRERELKNMGGASRRCPHCGITPQADHKPHGPRQPQPPGPRAGRQHTERPGPAAETSHLPSQRQDRRLDLDREAGS